MQRNLLPAIVLVLGLLALTNPQAALANPQDYLYGALARMKLNASPRPLTDVDFLGADGAPVKLSAFKGKFTILVLWATWCPYCIADMSTLSPLQDAFGKDKLQILAISVDRQGYKVAKKFMEESGYGNLDVYSDPDSMVGTTLGTRGIPYSLFINKEGLEVGRMPGATNWMSEETRNFLNYYIGE